MGDYSTNHRWNTGIVIAAALVMMAPILNPRLFIPLGLAVWTVLAIYAFIHSSGFDPTAELPWMVTYPTSVSILPVIGLALVGALGGWRGSLAMICCWFPAWFVPNYLLWLGLAAFGGSFDSWVNKNYQKSCEDRYGITMPYEDQGTFCTYTPNSGKKLPSFQVQNDKDYIWIRPYGQ